MESSSEGLKLRLGAEKAPINSQLTHRKRSPENRGLRRRRPAVYSQCLLRGSDGESQKGVDRDGGSERWRRWSPEKKKGVRNNLVISGFSLGERGMGDLRFQIPIIQDRWI